MIIRWIIIGIPIVWWKITGIWNDIGITTSPVPSPGVPVGIAPIERKTYIPAPVRAWSPVPGIIPGIVPGIVIIRRSIDIDIRYRTDFRLGTVQIIIFFIDINRYRFFDLLIGEFHLGITTEQEDRKYHYWKNLEYNFFHDFSFRLTVVKQLIYCRVPYYYRSTDK